MEQEEKDKRIQGEGGVKSLGFFPLVSVFFRSFLVQASWNFEKMQNMGIVFAMAPILQRLYTLPGEQREAVRRYLEFFNTHPYMASSLIGTLVKMEEEALRQKYSSREIHSFKERLMDTYGAAGDAFFWSTIKPLFLVSVLMGALKGSAATPLAFLVLYNLIHIGLRGYWFAKGYRKGVLCVDLIHDTHLPTLSRRLRYLTMFFVGICLLRTEQWMGIATSGWWDVAFMVVIVSLVGLFSFLLKRGMTIEAILFTLLVSAIAVRLTL